MLKIFHNFCDLRFSSLVELYSDSFINDGQRSMAAEQEFYFYLKDAFFSDKNAFYAVWEEDGRYVSALRMEPYRDGLLLEALQSAPEMRNKGLATKLLMQTLNYVACMGVKPVYSHIDKANYASMRVHEKCGFRKISESARFIDGSFSQKAYTYLFENK